MLFYFEKAEKLTLRVDNRNGSTGLFNELYCNLQRLVGIGEIMYDQRELCLVDVCFAVKFLPHGCTEAGASHRFTCTAASA